MPEKNKTYRARIEGYTSEGLGVARIDGQAVFVHRALRGEDCDVLILKALKNAAFGKAVRVYAPSPHRVEPDCPYYGRCGGCDFRHMDREEELEAKRQRVQDALRRIGGSDVTVEGILSGEPLHYRNKSQYPVSADGQVGFYKARSHQVIPVDCCRIQKPQADAAAEALRRYIRECGVPCYDERTRRGLVRHLYVRTNSAGQSLVCVLVNGRKLPREDTLVSLMRQALPDAVGVVLGVNTQPTGAVLGSEYRTLWGADVLEDTLCGLSFRLSVPSFYQVNHDMAEVLYDTAVDFAGLTGHETVLDLYCGAGTITQVMARRAARVIGAEIVPEAIADARENARRNGIENVEFFCGAAAAAAADFAAKGLRPDVICVDPPRKGLAPDVVEAAASMTPGPHCVCILRPGHSGPGCGPLCPLGLSTRPRLRRGSFPWHGPCGDGMFIVQTSKQGTYRDRSDDGRAGFDCCGEQSNLRGNQRICLGTYRTESQPPLYRTGEAEIRHH